MQKKMFFLIFISILSGCKGRSAASDLYKFAVTKDVEVQVNIAFKLDDTSGPLLDVTGKKFLLNAYALDANGQQVGIGTIEKSPVADYEVVMPGPNLSFDSIMRVPVEIQPRDGGYALRFELRESSSAFQLAGTDDSALSALRGDIQAGKDPESNKVTLSLVTTLAAQMIRNSLEDPGAASSIGAYKNLIDLLTPRLQTVEAAADSAKTQTLSVYASAMAAALKYQIVTDTALQSQLTAQVVTVGNSLSTDELKTAAIGKISTAISGLLVDYATVVKSRLGDTTTGEYQVFPTQSIDINSVPDPTEYSSAIFTPVNIAFTDSDNAATIGGAVTVTAPLFSSSVASYNIYFGGSERANRKLSLAGNIEATASPLILNLAAGTAVPIGATRLWAYPVTVGSAELDFPAFCVLVNVGGSNPTYPAAPTGVTSAASAGKNTLTWSAVTGATSYNVYWSTTTPVTLASNRIKSATSPYVQQILQKNVTYYYRVTAVKNGLESELSSEANAVAQSAATVPQNVTATAGSQSNVISWTALTGTTSYDLYWSSSSGVSTASNKISNVTSPYTHSGLTNGIAYYYAIVANTTSGSSGLSAEVHATPLTLSAPTNLAATPGIQSLTISWNAVTGATSYNLYCGTSSPVTKSATKYSGVTSPYTVTGLTAGTQYYCAAAAAGVGQESSLSTQVSAGALLNLTSGMSAYIVIGEPDFITAVPGASSTNFTVIRDVVFSSTGRIFIADAGQDRVLAFSALPTVSGAAFDFTIGSTSTSTSGGGGSADTRVDTPHGVAQSGSQLFVSDTGNKRIQVYDPEPSANGAAAVYTIGAANPNTNGMGGPGTCDATDIGNPRGIFATASRLYVADELCHRVLIFSLPITANQPTPLRILGQTTTTGGSSATTQSGMMYPTAVWSDDTKVAVADGGNNRVMIWNSFPTSNGQAADLVIGQPDFTSNTGATAQNRLMLVDSNSNPQGNVFYSGQQFFVADSGNNRVLIWNSWPNTNAQSADLVLGQTNFTSNSIATTQTTLYTPVTVRVKAPYIYVADRDNYRIMVWKSQ